MKTYDSSVKLHYLNASLDSNYEFADISDQKIIDRRWKKIERALKTAVPLVRKQYRQIGDEVLNLLKDIDFKYEDLQKKVNKKVRRYTEDKIELWQDLGVFTGYLKYLYTINKWTYKYVLKLLICGIYAEKFRKIKRISDDVFTIAAVDSYTQQIADRKLKIFPLLTSATILSFAMMPVMGNTYVEYLDSLLITQTEEMNAFVLTSEVINIEIDPNAMNIKLIKQANRIINVNENKYSGGLDDATRVVSNSAYTYTKDDVKVRFVAIIDDKTTKMCRSLNGQIFNVNKTNTFKRYSANQNGIVTVTCNGLVQGLNMPPITDHFHWCRSTLTYQI